MNPKEPFIRWAPQEITAINGCVMTTRYIAETHYDALAAELAAAKESTRRHAQWVCDEDDLNERLKARIATLSALLHRWVDRHNRTTALSVETHRLLGVASDREPPHCCSCTCGLTAETKPPKCAQCVYDVRNSGVCEICGTQSSAKETPDARFYCPHGVEWCNECDECAPVPTMETP